MRKAVWLLTILSAWSPAAAVVPEHECTSDGVRIPGVGPESPIVYDNDWWFDVFDNNYLWAQAPAVQI